MIKSLLESKGADWSSRQISSSISEGIRDIMTKGAYGEDVTTLSIYTPSEDFLRDYNQLYGNSTDFPTRQFHSGEEFDDGNGTKSTSLFPISRDEPTEYIFDRSDVRAVFLVLYTIVFCSCFFGNLMVILVVTLHWRMRSITNFCLANLAFADLCVGIFCVYQNIVTYLMDSWVFGEFMCKMYHFINSLSTTASVLILVVICIERYLAIIHPMTCKQMLTLNRLRITIVFVWILSAAISSPRFYYFSTISMPLPNDQYEILCLPNRTKYNSKLMDMISMTVLFLIPLTIIIILYTHIGIVLWKSSKNRMPASSTPSASVESSTSSGCYYRETDHNIIQTVKLTLLPVANRIKSKKHQRHGRRSSGKLRRKKEMQNVNCTPSPVGSRACKNCIANVTMSDTVTTAAVAAAGGGQEILMNCKACKHPYVHLHHCNPPPTMLMPPSTADEAIETTSFIQCCHNRNENESCVTPTNISRNVPGNWQHCKRNEAVNSPTTCCGGKMRRPRNICLKRQGSLENSVTFHSTNKSPPSPFCNRNYPCMEEGNCSNTEPIVLVKFEKKKKQSSKKGKGKSQCTILMNTKSCHGSGGDFSGNSPCNGNRKGISGGKGGSLDSDDVVDTESPQTTSHSPRFDCTICHPHSIEYCGESGVNGNDNHITGNTDAGNGALRGLHHHHHHNNSFQKNFSFEHKRNLSADSGISGMPNTTGRTNIEGGPCDQNFDGHYLPVASGACGALCPSCGTGCVESHQLSRCHHNRHHQHPSSFASSCGSGSQKLSHFVSSNGSALPGVAPAAPSAPKRIRRMRVVRSSKYGTSALLSRRRIIRMLIVVVLAFALCHLPFHARKVWQYWSPKWAPYQAGSVFSTLFTPITFLIMYANSAINPILYAFMSKKFRMSFKDLLCCKMRHSLRMSRNASVRSTHAVAL